MEKAKKFEEIKLEISKERKAQLIEEQAMLISQIVPQLFISGAKIAKRESLEVNGKKNLKIMFGDSIIFELFYGEFLATFTVKNTLKDLSFDEIRSIAQTIKTTLDWPKENISFETKKELSITLKM